MNSTTPVIASFSNDGRTITLSPPSAAAPASAQAAPAAAAPRTPAVAEQPATPSSAAPIANRRYFAVVDASHGGDDHGETLSNTLLEKDVTVALARSLRQELESRGITTLVLRDSDTPGPLPLISAPFSPTLTARRSTFPCTQPPAVTECVSTLPCFPSATTTAAPSRSWEHSPARPDLQPKRRRRVPAELQKRQIPVRTLAAAVRPLIT